MRTNKNKTTTKQPTKKKTTTHKPKVNKRTKANKQEIFLYASVLFFQNFNSILRSMNCSEEINDMKTLRVRRGRLNRVSFRPPFYPPSLLFQC